MKRDYYIVLGVNRSADLNRIKKAYRTVAKQCHPDATHSAGSAARFREVKEAYETLSDEDSRRRYDQQLTERESEREGSMATKPVRRSRGPFHETIREGFGPLDEFFAGFVPRIFHREIVPEKDLYCEVILSPREAAEGGLFPLRLPVTEACPVCHGTGYGDFVFCSRCFGSGSVQGEREFSVSVPPNVRHGTEVRLSLEDIGLKDAVIQIAVFIDPHLEMPHW
jgi:molecular chaperone DnaJ